MTVFKLQVDNSIIACTACEWNGWVHRGSRLKRIRGPAIELTVTSFHDDLRRFSVPYPISNQALLKNTAANGPMLTPGEARKLNDKIYDFIKYVINNHGISNPYRVAVSVDCIVATHSVAAKGMVGTVDADEFAPSWF